MAWIGILLRTLGYSVIMCAIAYWVIRYAVKHGVRDALSERDKTKKTDVASS
jgi:hypothetical protein